MSVVKCRASASSAWLLCFWATRRSMAARLTSTSREMRMMITPHHDGVISGASKKSRLTASCTIQPQVTSSRDRFPPARKGFRSCRSHRDGFRPRAGRDADGEEVMPAATRSRAAVQGLGKDTEAVGGEPGSELDERQEQRPEQRREGRVLFFGMRFVVRGFGSHENTPGKWPPLCGRSRKER